MLISLSIFISGKYLSPENSISHLFIKYKINNYKTPNSIELHYYEASVERIPVEDNWADVFVSYETIEHVTV